MQTMKQCISCRRELPLTPENFYWKKHHRRANPFPESKCKDCSKKYGKEYKQANRTKLSDIAKKYNQSPKGIYRKLGKFKNGWKVTITQNQFLEWYQLQPKKCCYCGIPETELMAVKDKFNNKSIRLTIDRMDSSVGYAQGNLALCCYRCNLIKNDFFTHSEMVKIGRLFISPKWKKHVKQV